MKVLVGAFSHESNDFCPHITTRDKFEFYEGEEAIEHLPVRDIFENAGIEIIPCIYARAESLGPVAEETFLYFEEKILKVLRENPDVDGVWMHLHGAMNVLNIGSGEYRLACDMREIVGDECVFSFGMDLHGNIEPDFANKVNIFRCYHTAPHTDQPDTYRRTAKVLVDYLQKGYKMHPKLRKLRMIFPGEMAATTVEPFKSIIAKMKDWEENDPAIACASLYIGFAWTDAPRTSSTVVVVPSAPEYVDYCEKKADELAEYVFGRRREFGFEVLALRPAETAKHSLYEMEPPVCVTDMGDNPTAGTTGGSLVLLKEYLKIADPTKRVLVVGIYDPSAYDVCRSHEAGDEFDLKLGVDIDEVTRPITLHVVHRGWHDILGYDIITNPPIRRSSGVTVSTGSIDIIIVNEPIAFTQKVNFESCEIDASAYDVFVTKFGYIFPELKELSKNAIMSNTPGESYQMVQEFNYKHVIRPIYPVDDI